MKPTTFRIELRADAAKGTTVTVYDSEHFDQATGQPMHTVIFSVTVNVCLEEDARRRALADAARFLDWYMRPA